MNSSDKLRVGFGRADITPVESVRLAGFGNTERRMSEEIFTPLTATALAFSDEAEHTVLLITVDLLCTPDVLTQRVRAEVRAVTGLADSRILISATHTHSAPSVYEPDAPDIARYYPLLVSRIGEAAKAAMEDRAEASLFAARRDIPGLNFVRRYRLADGDWLTDNYNGWRFKEIVGHESDADPEMQLLKVVRPGKKDLLLCNWQAHPKMSGTGGQKNVSADFVSPFRDALEEKFGCLCAYFTGGAGNLNPISRIPEEDPTHDFREYGALLASRLFDLTDADFVPVAGDRVESRQLIYTAQSNRATPELLEKANEIYEMWRRDGDLIAASRAGMPFGVHSPYHAGNLLRSVRLPEYQELELDAFSLGGAAFVTAPYEMFDSNAKEIKTRSPFPLTFVCTSANGKHGYVPSDEGCRHKGYENDCTELVPGSGGKLRDAFLQLLADLHG